MEGEMIETPGTSSGSGEEPRSAVVLSWKEELKQEIKAELKQEIEAQVKAEILAEIEEKVLAKVLAKLNMHFL